MAKFGNDDANEKVYHLGTVAHIVDEGDAGEQDRRRRKDATANGARMQTEEIFKLYFDRLTAEADRTRAENQTFLADVRAREAEIRAEVAKATQVAETIRADNRVFMTEIRLGLDQIKGDNDKAQMRFEFVQKAAESSANSIRHNQSVTATWMTAIIATMLAIIIFISGYIVTRIDSMETRIKSTESAESQRPMKN